MNYTRLSNEANDETCDEFYGNRDNNIDFSYLDDDDDDSSSNQPSSDGDDDDESESLANWSSDEEDTNAYYSESSSSSSEEEYTTSSEYSPGYGWIGRSQNVSSNAGTLVGTEALTSFVLGDNYRKDRIGGAGTFAIFNNETAAATHAATRNEGVIGRTANSITDPPTGDEISSQTTISSNQKTPLLRSTKPIQMDVADDVALHDATNITTAIAAVTTATSSKVGSDDVTESAPVSTVKVIATNPTTCCGFRMRSVAIAATFIVLVTVVAITIGLTSGRSSNKSNRIVSTCQYYSDPEVHNGQLDLIINGTNQTLLQEKTQRKLVSIVTDTYNDVVGGCNEDYYVEATFTDVVDQYVNISEAEPSMSTTSATFVGVNVCSPGTCEQSAPFFGTAANNPTSRRQLIRASFANEFVGKLRKKLKTEFGVDLFQIREQNQVDGKSIVYNATNERTSCIYHVDLEMYRGRLVIDLEGPNLLNSSEQQEFRSIVQMAYNQVVGGCNETSYIETGDLDVINQTLAEDGSSSNITVQGINMCSTGACDPSMPFLRHAVNTQIDEFGMMIESKLGDVLGIEVTVVAVSEQNIETEEVTRYAITSRVPAPSNPPSVAIGLGPGIGFGTEEPTSSGSDLSTNSPSVSIGLGPGIGFGTEEPTSSGSDLSTNSPSVSIGLGPGIGFGTEEPTSSYSDISSNVTTLPLSNIPSSQPTLKPTLRQSFSPSTGPSSSPSLRTPSPSMSSDKPSLLPSLYPSLRTPAPSFSSVEPSSAPSPGPTVKPSSSPSTNPSSPPTRNPTRLPTSRPTFSPTLRPSPSPTLKPSVAPSSQPLPQTLTIRGTNELEGSIETNAAGSVDGRKTWGSVWSVGNSHPLWNVTRVPVLNFVNVYASLSEGIFETNYIRICFDMPENFSNGRISIRMIADDWATVYMNGNSLKRFSGYDRYTSDNFNGLRPGANNILMQIRANGGLVGFTYFIDIGVDAARAPRLCAAEYGDTCTCGSQS